MPIDIKFHPQPVVRGQTGGLGSGQGGPISENQRRTISGIVFEKYALHLLSKFLEDKGIQVLYNESLVGFLESKEFNVGEWWYILINNWLLFFSKMPFYELYGYSISDETFRRRFKKNKPTWWAKDKDRRTVTWLLKTNNISKIEISPLAALLRREDFLLVAEFTNSLLVSPMDAKYRSASRTWLTTQDLRRLYVYYKLLLHVLHEPVRPYVIGNRSSFSRNIWKRDDRGEWVKSSKYMICIRKQKDGLFGNVEEIQVYANSSDDPDAEGDHGRLLFSFRYVPIDLLQSALGVYERFVHVVVVPVKTFEEGKIKLEWSWHAVSERVYWLPRYSLNAPQWGLNVDAYEVASGHLRTGNYELFRQLEKQRLGSGDIVYIHSQV